MHRIAWFVSQRTHSIVKMIYPINLKDLMAHRMEKDDFFPRHCSAEAVSYFIDENQCAVVSGVHHSPVKV